MTDEALEIVRRAAEAGRWHDWWADAYSPTKDGSLAESKAFDELLEDLFQLTSEEPSIEAIVEVITLCVRTASGMRGWKLSEVEYLDNLPYYRAAIQRRRAK